MIPFILILPIIFFALNFFVFPILFIALPLFAFGLCSLLVAASAFSFAGGLLLPFFNPRILNHSHLLAFIALSSMIGTSSYIPLVTSGLGLAVGATLALCLFPVVAASLSVGFFSLICKNISFSCGTHPPCHHSSEFVCCRKNIREGFFPPSCRFDRSSFARSSEYCADGIDF